jgi:hypothetical protein
MYRQLIWCLMGYCPQVIDHAIWPIAKTRTYFFYFCLEHFSLEPSGWSIKIMIQCRLVVNAWTLYFLSWWIGRVKWMSVLGKCTTNGMCVGGILLLEEVLKLWVFKWRVWFQNAINAKSKISELTTPWCCTKFDFEVTHNDCLGSLRISLGNYML